MKRSTEVILVRNVFALTFGFNGRASSFQYLWQVALEEIEGSMQH